MTPRQFASALSATRLDPQGRAVAAARLTLVDGLSRNAAARRVGCDIRAVSRAVERLQPRQRCECCGQMLPG